MLSDKQSLWLQTLPRHARRIGSQAGGVDLRVDRRHRHISQAQSKKGYEARKQRREQGIQSLRPAPRCIKLQWIDGSICNGIKRRGDGWIAQAHHDDKQVYLGTWPTQQDASKAWCTYMAKYWQSAVGQERIKMLAEKLKYSDSVPISNM